MAGSLDFNYQTRLSDLAAQLRGLLQRAFPGLAIGLGCITAWLYMSNRPGALTFALLSAGALIGLGVWRTGGVGLPMLPMMCVQHLVAYGLPILVRHPVVNAYPSNVAMQAGLELMLFLAAMTAGWSISLRSTQAGRPVAHLLGIMVAEGMGGLSRLGFMMIWGATIYQLLFSVGLLTSMFEMLPAGSYPIVFALVSAVTSCGLFLVSMLLASGQLSRSQQSAFWTLLAVNTLLTASGFLLSATALLLFSVAIGLFWGSGRMPWRFVLIVALGLAFLNLGKFEMRGLYWHREDEFIEPTTLTNMPERYAQWVEASWTVMMHTEEEADSLWLAQQRQLQSTTGEGGQSLLLRVNNLQNILYVIDQMQAADIEPLRGRTYTMIPALLIPRILWPEKPRTHEGQVLLNVHFGRQTRESTIVTYIAWGLVAEAYGNFGPLMGTIFVGFGLGALFGWLEKKSSSKPLLSLEGFLVFIVFVSATGSFEMVASVLVTSIFQSLVPVAIIGSFFVKRIRLPS